MGEETYLINKYLLEEAYLLIRKKVYNDRSEGERMKKCIIAEERHTNKW